MISCTARITGQPPMAEARIFDQAIRVAAHPHFDDMVGTEQQVVLVGYPAVSVFLEQMSRSASTGAMARLSATCSTASTTSLAWRLSMAWSLLG